MKRRFVLLDRDGTINAERHYLASPDGLELLPNTLAGLQRMAKSGLGLVVISNQSGVSRGYIEPEALAAIHERLHALLAAGGVTLDGIYVCPHTDGHDCACRKPRPGMVQQAAADLGFDPADAFVIGDKACDIDLGRAVRATTLLVRTGYGAQVGTEVEGRAHHVAADLLEAAELIERELIQEEPPAFPT
jgi:D-glycero-D-manno-heptose 1,7-bisphosphate phosphatase